MLAARRDQGRIAMNFRHALIVIASLAVLAGCGPRGEAGARSEQGAAARLNANTAEGKTVEMPARNVGARVAALDALLRDKPAYADARRALIGAGWVPVPDPRSKENVIGSNWKEVCATDPAQCEACDKLPELASASGDGQVLMRFRDPDGGQVIAVHATGMLSDYAVTGPDSRLAYMGWSMETPGPAH